MCEGKELCILPMPYTCFPFASVCTFMLMLKLFRLAAAMQMEEQVQQKRDLCVWMLRNRV